MCEQEKINRELKKYPWMHPSFFRRPHWTRRQFFEVAGAVVTGAFLAERYAKADAVTTNSGAATLNTAKNVIFILLAGAPSHTDTFDLKVVDGVTPASFAPDTVNGVLWPTGLLPKLAQQLPNIAIVRSMRA